MVPSMYSDSTISSIVISEAEWLEFKSSVTCYGYFKISSYL